MQRDLRALAVGVGADVLTHPDLAASVGDQRHAQHQILVHRPAAVADVTGDVPGDDGALGEPDQHVTGQRAPVVHVRHRPDRRLGALGAAVVVRHLRIRGQRIVELRGVGNGEHLEAVRAELGAQRVGHVEQQRGRELHRVERVQLHRGFPGARYRDQLDIRAARVLEFGPRLRHRRRHRGGRLRARRHRGRRGVGPAQHHDHDRHDQHDHHAHSACREQRQKAMALAPVGLGHDVLRSPRLRG